MGKLEDQSYIPRQNNTKRKQLDQSYIPCYIFHVIFQKLYFLFYISEVIFYLRQNYILKKTLANNYIYVIISNNLKNKRKDKS